MSKPYGVTLVFKRCAEAHGDSLSQSALLSLPP